VCADPQSFTLDSGSTLVNTADIGSACINDFIEIEASGVTSCSTRSGATPTNTRYCGRALHIQVKGAISVAICGMQFLMLYQMISKQPRMNGLNLREDTIIFDFKKNIFLKTHMSRLFFFSFFNMYFEICPIRHSPQLCTKVGVFLRGRRRTYHTIYTLADHALSKMVCPPVFSEAGARRPRSISNY
jgi:hypothetical protein